MLSSLLKSFDWFILVFLAERGVEWWALVWRRNRLGSGLWPVKLSLFNVLKFRERLVLLFNFSFVFKSDSLMGSFGHF